MSEDDPLQSLRARLAEATRDELLELLLFYERALLELHDGLMEAARSRRGKSAACDRASAHQALHAMNRFLHAYDMQDLSSPLVLLEGALLDLEHGLTPAIFTACADGDRKPPRSKQLRGYAAGIMGGLMKHAGMSRRRAEEWVSKKLHAAGHEVAPLTVRDWRQDALNNTTPELYEAYCTLHD